MELTRLASMLILVTSVLFTHPANAQTNLTAGPVNELYAQVFTADSVAHTETTLMAFLQDHFS